jgi:catechol 2,3-dioxygenase-like lactoylglutathione lyase family enzyme
MFKRIACVSIYTDGVEESLRFYEMMGLSEKWRIQRTLEDGRIWTLVGLNFPEDDSSELVLSNHPDIRVTEIEIHVEDVTRRTGKFQRNIPSNGFESHSQLKATPSAS